MTPSLRPALQSDWPAIAALLDQAQLPLDGAADHLSDFVVAQAGDTVVGAGGLEIYGDSALLRSLVVGQRGTGLGARIVVALLERARERGVRDVVLLTTTAASYFPRFGFVTIPREEVPDVLRISREFQGACPASAEVMRLRLRHDELP